MSKHPQAEVHFSIKIKTGTRPEDETDWDWSSRILSTILPQMLGKISYQLTSDPQVADRMDGKPMEHEAVMDSLCAVLCENLCSTWFMSGGSKQQLMLILNDVYSNFEEEMTSAVEEQDPDNDIPIPTVTGVGHA